MDLLLSHKSALEYWRLHGMTQVDLKHRQRRRTPPLFPPSDAALKSLDTRGVLYPLDVIVGETDTRRNSKLARCHFAQAPLPEGCIVDVGGGLSVVSPEYCLFQLARKLPFARIVQLGLELCGGYTLAAHKTGFKDPDDAKRGFVDRPPLTSKERLASVLARTAGSFDQRRLTSALRYIENGSSSPRETILYLLLILPYRYGGYGFPVPVLNPEFKPVRGARKSASKKHFNGDLFWPEHKLDVEYDSIAHHDKEVDRTRDSAKRNSLLAMGITVISVTNDQLCNSEEFERLAQQMATHSDRRLWHKNNPKFAESHRQLRGLLGID